MYKSSSEAERDINKLKQVYAGDKKSSISQTTPQAKMRVQVAVSEEGKRDALRMIRRETGG
jgi:hypothetical protein